MQNSALVLKMVKVAGDDVTGALGVDKYNGPLFADQYQLLLQDTQLLIVLHHVHLQLPMSSAAWQLAMHNV